MRGVRSVRSVRPDGAAAVCGWKGAECLLTRVGMCKGEVEVEVESEGSEWG